MKILITGATGFIGTNLINRINQEGNGWRLILANSKTTEKELQEYAGSCDAVFYLAAVHRSNNAEDFKRYNSDLLGGFLKALERAGNRCPILFTSSRQAGDSSPYGISKIDAERLVWEHADRCASSSVVYRLTNTFGRYARPNGHSVVATFCYNLQRNIPIAVNNADRIMQFYYIDEVVDSLVQSMQECLKSQAHIRDQKIYRLPENMVYEISLGKLAEKLCSFKQARDRHIEPVANTLFEQRLLYTYDGYSPEVIS